MNEEARETIKQYKTQIIAVIFTILALFISIYVLADLIRVAKGEDPTGNLQKGAIQKSEISSLIILIVTLYFAYAAYKTYKKNPSQANFTFLIAVLFVLIAAFMRFLTITNSDTVSGVEDVI